VITAVSGEVRGTLDGADCANLRSEQGWSGQGEESAHVSTKSILVVDHQTDILGLLEDALSARGCKVSTAASAEGALQLLWDNAYDVAIVNDNLPGVDAVDLFVQIRHVDPNLVSRTIFLSRKTPEPIILADPGSDPCADGVWLPDASDVDQLLMAVDKMFQRPSRGEGS
jgi:CheY-like chemotaxis protein